MTFCDAKSQGSLDINQDVVLECDHADTIRHLKGFDLGVIQRHSLESDSSWIRWLGPQKSLPFGEERLHPYGACNC